MSHPAVPPSPAPEPGSVTLPPWAVVSLRQKLASARDKSATREARNDARLDLTGYLAGLFDLADEGRLS